MRGMSHVTNIVLCLGNDDRRKIDLINQFFEPPTKGFVSCDDPALPKGWYGGSKYLEAAIYIGVFNHLNIHTLIQHFLSIAWSEPNNVQLAIKDQWDERFRFFNFEDFESASRLFVQT
jgi:hypothetical protein